MVINIYVFNSKHNVRRFVSDQGFILEDAHVFLIGDVQELADIVDVGLSHRLAIVLLNEEACIEVIGTGCIDVLLSVGYYLPALSRLVESQLGTQPSGIISWQIDSSQVGLALLCVKIH